MPYLNTSLSRFFDTNPIYVLSQDKSKTKAAASKSVKRLDTKPGALVISSVNK
nr:DUF1439 domain-containing protein [Xenorhabdus japonica]